VAEQLVVDANPVLAALLGGRAREIFFSRLFQFCSPQAALFEVAKYIPAVAKHAELPEIHFYREFQLLPIEACQPSVYEQFQDDAEALIGHRDPRDVPVLSLAMARRLPIWSNDKDFEGLAGVQVFKTSELISRLIE
jgi:predicted nucleic acid-binding protein